MNVREGMRRLGILLGACGGIFGGCLAYSDARTTWDNHTAHRKFESLMASPTMQKVAKAARDYLRPSKFGGIRVVESQTLTYADGTIWEQVSPLPDFKGRLADPDFQRSTHVDLSKLSDEQLEAYQALRSKKPATVSGAPFAAYQKPLAPPPAPDFDQWKAEQQRASELKAAGAILVSVNLDGIKQVTADEVGVVSSIQLSTGESVQRVDPLAPKAYLIPLLYPVLGFLLPWGGIRILTWVGSGFFVENRK